LNDRHLLDGFQCGEQLLDEWLTQRALANQMSGASRTFVIADASQRVFGYYTLAAGSAARKSAPSIIRRNTPDPVPVIVLGRLAVSTVVQGQRLGSALLRDALLRCQAVALHAGVKAMMVHALTEAAAGFYRTHGFLPSPMEAMTLMLPLPLPVAEQEPSRPR
jgi:GNAT superfamily N-acetyltransferase